MSDFDIPLKKLQEVAAKNGVTPEQIKQIGKDLIDAVPSDVSGFTIGGGKTKIPVGKLVTALGWVGTLLRRR